MWASFWKRSPHPDSYQRSDQLYAHWSSLLLLKMEKCPFLYFKVLTNPHLKPLDTRLKKRLTQQSSTESFSFYVDCMWWTWWEKSCSIPDSNRNKYVVLKYVCQFLPTHGLAPDESSCVVLFNKGLQFSPDTQVGANPLHMARVTTARPTDIQIIFYSFYYTSCFLYCINIYLLH